MLPKGVYIFTKNNLLSYFVSGGYVIFRQLLEQYMTFTPKMASKCSWPLYRSQLFTNIMILLFRLPIQFIILMC